MTGTARAVAARNMRIETIFMVSMGEREREMPWKDEMVCLFES